MENKPTFQFGPIQTQWLESLENNPERQHIRALGYKLPDGSYKACCLGELGLMTGLCEWDGESLVSKMDGVKRWGILNKRYGEIGLNSCNGHNKDRTISLAKLNDEGNTWPQIAAIVRANPEDYFNKSF